MVFCLPCGGHNGRFVCHADAKTVLPCRGTSPEGAEGGSHPREQHDASMDNINGSEKERKVTHVHGKPLRPFGPTPLQSGGVLTLDGQTLCCDGFQICRSISAEKHETVPHYISTAPFS